jgi:hypothetical protein
VGLPACQERKRPTIYQKLEDEDVLQILDKLIQRSEDVLEGAEEELQQERTTLLTLTVKEHGMGAESLSEEEEKKKEVALSRFRDLRNRIDAEKERLRTAFDRQARDRTDDGVRPGGAAPVGQRCAGRDDGWRYLLSRETLEAALREHGVADLSGVEMAVLAIDGSISVVPVGGTTQAPREASMASITSNMIRELGNAKERATKQLANRQLRRLATLRKEVTHANSIGP